VPGFANLDEVPARPEFAYLLTRKNVTATLIDRMAAKGVKRVLFKSMMLVDEVTLERCKPLGIQTAVASPMTALGGSFH